MFHEQEKQRIDWRQSSFIGTLGSFAVDKPDPMISTRSRPDTSNSTHSPRHRQHWVQKAPETGQPPLPEQGEATAMTTEWPGRRCTAALLPASLRPPASHGPTQHHASQKGIVLPLYWASLNHPYLPALSWVEELAPCGTGTCEAALHGRPQSHCSVCTQRT